ATFQVVFLAQASTYWTHIKRNCQSLHFFSAYCSELQGPLSLEMSNIPGMSLSALECTLPPNNTTNAILATFITPAVATLITHYASPQRLTIVLLNSIADAEETYLEACESGLLSPDTHTVETLSSLQLKVSKIHEESLRAYNHCASVHMGGSRLQDSRRGKPFFLYDTMRHVDGNWFFKIAKEAQLRAEGNSNLLATRAVFLSRRAL
ncbi:hypothetical protein B0H19DRAFT_1295028, partial [Mycena capillaripes]